MSSASLVTLEHVDVEIDGAPILHDVTWQLRAGEHWGIIGANGSGKTTLLRLIAGSAWPAPERGLRRYDFGFGPETDALRARVEVALVGHELQDRYTKLGWNFTALDVVLSGIYRTDVPRRPPTTEERTLALELLGELGVAALAPRALLTLSRGEQRRVLIARALGGAPRVLLLDEPASGLDAAARTELAATLARVAARCTLVCTAHLRDDLPTFVTRQLTIVAGRIVANDVHGTPETDATADRAPRIAPAVAAKTKPLIALTNADVWLAGRHVLHGLDWQLAPGTHWLVTGANGSGKSTLLRLLHGQLRPALGGTLAWPALGNPRNIWELRRQVAWLSPELQAAYRYPTTVRGCLASGFSSSIGQTRTLTPTEDARVVELLADLELTELADRALTSLSYGQARRALIGRALANRPRVLLLDEPWEGLDGPMAALLNRTLHRVTGAGTQLVCASHLRAHREHFTHELALVAGRALFAGAVTQ